MAERPSQRRVLVATLLGVFLASFPSVILVAALPDIAREFGVGESSVGWVLTAPMIAGSVLVPTFGRLGDLRGHRRVFLIGFVLSSALAGLTALAWDVGPLIGLRTAAHVAGVATGPTALALLMATHGPAERPHALGAWAFAGASAPVIGLLAGGPLIGLMSWRVLFVMQAVVGFAALPLCLRALPETPRKPGVNFDVLGGLTLMLGSGAAVFALDRSAPWGSTALPVLGAAALAPLALWLFVKVERRTPDPLFPLRLARQRPYVAPVAGEAMLQVPSIGAFFIAPLILTTTFDRSVAEVAYLLIPMPLGMSALAPVGGRLTVRLGERRTSILGALLMTSALGIGAFGNAAEILPLVVLGFAVHGAAMGISRPSFTSAAALALDDSTTGVGMAVMRMLSQLGSAAGISMAVAARGAGGFTAVYAVLAVVGLASAASSQLIVDHREGDEESAMVGAMPALDS